MRRVLVIFLALTTLLAGCTSSPKGGGTDTTPGLTDSQTSAAGATADQIADAYNRDVDGWTSGMKTLVDKLDDYPTQISIKHDTAAQLAAQKKDCETATSAQTRAQTPPVLDNAPDSGPSPSYKAAEARDKTVRARAKAVRVLLDAVVRFCTWLNALESGETEANAANASLFSQPLRYTGTIKVKGVSHTCPDGSSCYTPDQSLWPKIAQLWQKQGAATAQGASAIKANKLPCLVKGWDAACDLVLQNQLDYQKWTDEYAKAFDDNKAKDLQTAAAAISTVGAKFDREVLLPLSNLPGIYRQLAPGQKYDARASTTGEDIWIAHIKEVLKQLKAAAAQL